MYSWLLFTLQRVQNVLHLFSEAEKANLLNDDLYKTWVRGKSVISFHLYMYMYFSKVVVRPVYMYHIVE